MLNVYRSKRSLCNRATRAARRLVFCLLAACSATVFAQRPASEVRLTVTNPLIQRPNYSLVYNRCQRVSFGVECSLTITATRKTQVRYSKHAYLAERGGHRTPVSWISIGGDGQDAPRNIGDYRYLEPGQSTDIVFRFSGKIGELESLGAGFDSFGVKTDVFLFTPQR